MNKYAQLSSGTRTFNFDHDLYLRCYFVYSNRIKFLFFVLELATVKGPGKTSTNSSRKKAWIHIYQPGTIFDRLSLIPTEHDTFMYLLITLGGCPGWSSLRAPILLVLSCHSMTWLHLITLWSTHTNYPFRMLMNHTISKCIFYYHHPSAIAVYILTQHYHNGCLINYPVIKL